MDFLISPLVNALVFLYSIFGNSFPLALILLTVVLRLVTLPLTLPQQRSMRRMSALQPQLKELQKKYAGNKQKLGEEQMKLYKEYGVNPLGGCLPLILQLFIMIAFYNAITGALALNPLQLMGLSQRVGPDIAPLLPIDSQFSLFGLLTWDLGQPDPYFILPILVVATTYLQQKLMSPSNPDPTTAATTRQMNIMMPLMFGLFALQYASGLSIYFIVSNLIGIVQFGLIGRRLNTAPVALENKGKALTGKAKAAAKK